jgi:hypothetical protein
VNTKGDGVAVKTFVLVVYVLFGALAVIAALAGIAFMIGGVFGAGVILVIFAAVLTVMSLSVRRSWARMG